MSRAILDAQWSDGGEYSCRVGIPTRFIDHKINIELVIVRVRPLKRYQIKLRFNPPVPVEESITEEMIVPTDKVRDENSISLYLQKAFCSSVHFLYISF